MTDTRSPYEPPKALLSVEDDTPKTILGWLFGSGRLITPLLSLCIINVLYAGLGMLTSSPKSIGLGLILAAISGGILVSQSKILAIFLVGFSGLFVAMGVFVSFYSGRLRFDLILLVVFVLAIKVLRELWRKRPAPGQD